MWWGGEGGGVLPGCGGGGEGGGVLPGCGGEVREVVLPGCGGEVREVECYLGVVGR